MNSLQLGLVALQYTRRIHTEASPQQRDFHADDRGVCRANSVHDLVWTSSLKTY